MKVSVVIPVYNVEKYLKECLDSVINQTLEDIEIIAIDDGSPDGSGQILDNYAKRDNRVKVLHKKNEGVSAARNDGLKVCRGDYIYIMDSDDYLEKDALEVMYNNAIATAADVVITDHYTFKEDNFQNAHHFFSKEFVTDDHDIIMQIQNMVLHLGYSPYFTTENTGLGIAAPWTKLLHRDIIYDNGLEFDSFVQGIFDDGLFCIHVFEYAKRVSYIKTYTYHYRILQNSLIHRYNEKRIEIDKKVFQRIEEFRAKYSKDNMFQEAYYARVILYLVHSYGVYFFHKNYKGALGCNYNEFMRTMKSEPYKLSIEKVNINKLKKVQKYVVILSRHHLNWVIWCVFQVRKIFKK